MLFVLSTSNFPFSSVNSRKISGCAQTRKNGIILHHGTLLLSVDFERMFSLLRVPDEKMRDKAIRNARERVTGLENVLMRAVDVPDLVGRLCRGFEDTLGISLEPGTISPEEEGLAREIASEVHDSREWLYER